MSLEDTNTTGGESRSGSSNWILGLIALVCFALAVGSLSGLSCLGRRALDRQLASMEASGGPLTLSELRESLPEIPDEANSALVLIGLIDKLQPIPRGDNRRKLVPLAGNADPVHWGESWPAVTVKAIEDYIAEMSPVLARLDKIRDMPNGRFPDTFDPSKPILDQLMPSSAAAVRSAAKLEALAAIRDALNGSPVAALDRIETITNIGASMANDSMLISSLCVLGINNLAIDTVEFVLSTAEATPDQLVALQRLWERVEERYVMPDGLRGERLVLRTVMVDLSKGRLGDGQHAAESREAMWSAISWVGNGWIEKNEAKILELFNPLIQAGTSVDEALKAARLYDRNVDQLGKFYVFASIAMPSLQRAIELWAKHDARLRCAQAALAAERYRIDHGDWPTTLDALVPAYIDAVPIDPFVGEKVRYVQEDGGIVVYSVAENGVDDGAELEVESRKQAPPRDVGFRLAAPDERIVRISTP